MTKQNLIDLVYDRLASQSNSDTKGRYHKKVIEKLIEIVLADLWANVNISINRYADLLRKDGFVKTFTGIEIDNDLERNEKYITLPVDYVKLPNDSGIVMVSPMQDQSYKCIRRANNLSSIYDTLGTQNYTDRIPYYVEGSKMFFPEIYKPIPDWFTKVLVKLLTFSGLESNDPVNIPAGKGSEFFNMVFQMAANKLPEDTKQDLQSVNGQQQGQ